MKLKLFNNNEQKNIIYTLPLLIIICSGLIGTTSVFASSIEDSQFFEANLNGTQVSPPVNTSASGYASIFYKSVPSDLTDFLLYNISISNIEDVTQIHLHQGPFKLNGTTIINLPILQNYKETGILSTGNISQNDSFQFELGGKGEYVMDVLMGYLSTEIFI